MYKLSKSSKEKLETCHIDLQEIIYEVLKIYDITILEGLRSTEKQQEYFKKGLSQLDGITKKSKHQADRYGFSNAIDIMPYSAGTNAFSGKKEDTYRFYFMAGIMISTANRLFEEGTIKHRLRWGGDWNSNNIYSDQNFNDLPHFELI